MNRINLNKIKNWILLFALLFSFHHVLAGKEIKGFVVDQKGRPVPFASVLFSDGKGTIANAEGAFSFEPHSQNQNIKISAVGFDPVIYSLNQNEATIRIELKEAVSELNEVVVTGNINMESVKNSVYQVRSIEKLTIQNRAANNLQEVLNTELGIRFSQDNALGTSNLEMMGMSGQNVKILIDGVPMVGRQGVSNEVNINQIDINTIEKIEIIEGPMSVVYGADALAGVINIITKNPKQVSGFSIQARVQEETVGESYSPLAGNGNHIRNISGSYTFKKPWKIGGGFTQNRFGGWKGKYTGRQFEWLPRDQDMGNFFVGTSFKGFDIDYALDILSETITSYGPENRLEVIDRNFITTRWMHRLNGKWDLSPTFKLSWQGAYTDYGRRTETWVTNVRTNQSNLSAAPDSQAAISYSGFTWRVLGLLLISPKLNLQPGIDINTERGSGERISENEGIQDYAAFLTGEWSPTDKIKFRPGLRKAYNSAYQAPPVIPSINSKFVLSQSWDLRLAYARGFRAPSIRELYFDFFDASHSIIGNPSLKAETSHSFNGSLNFQKEETGSIFEKVVLSGFYNEVSDRISFGVDPNDPRITTLFNIASFRTVGLMLNQKIAFGSFSGELGISRIGRYNQLSAEQAGIPEMLFTTEVNTTVSYLIPLIKTHVNVFYKWTGALPGFEMATDLNGNQIPNEIKLDGFHWIDLTFRKPIGNDLSVNFGARNIMDITDIQSTSGVSGGHGGGPQRPVGYGRSYFLGLTYRFSQ
ncbi:TonB-dependent receptor [Aquiflexum gelatinilyticum]|uniref:TonB-dependent receptor n=1 Tax=Aquiflexum gelatinilyticum TaxID=2961943 RepID=A0A9X2T0P8_9BACT|nr:TonB-dependent receptor [Aquiflexum gelatinilyticum]MCR9015096.1 TonB-dependent receptor [Aquiflexum gelatinilyticum]